MKVKDMKEMIGQDIQDLEAHVLFLQGNTDSTPEFNLEDLASLEFVDGIKKESVEFDSLLWSEEVSEAEYSVYFYQRYQQDPKIDLGDGEFWTPAAIRAWEHFQ